MTIPAAPTVRTPQRQPLPEEVASYVRELIISGEVKPGEFLRIEPIAEAVGVSNTPVREGLLSLRGQGFVRLAPRRGFVVAPFSEQDVRDLFWAQAQLSGELAARAAKKIDSDALARLEGIHGRYAEVVASGDEQVLADLGHQFHREINLAADSYRLALLLSTLVKYLPNRFYTRIEGQVTHTTDDHPAILRALRARETQKVRSLMEQHIQRGGDRLIETLWARGVWDADTPRAD